LAKISAKATSISTYVTGTRIQFQHGCREAGSALELLQKSENCWPTPAKQNQSFFTSSGQTMADYLSEAEWKKNVNTLLGLIHRKTGITEALKKYAQVRKDKAPPKDKIAALDDLVTVIDKAKTAHKSKKPAIEYLEKMSKLAESEKDEAEELQALVEKHIPFKTILTNISYLTYFQAYAKKENSEENIEFYLEMKRGLNYERAVKFTEIFVNPNGKKGINCPETIYKTCQKIIALDTVDEDQKLTMLKAKFKEVLKAAEINMSETGTRFVVSDDYIRMVCKDAGKIPWV
jgi:hypothetical protein